MDKAHYALSSLIRLAQIKTLYDVQHMEEKAESVGEQLEKEGNNFLDYFVRGRDY